MPVSSTSGSHVGGTGGLNAIGVLDAPCTLLADGPPTVWGEIWLMNVSDKKFTRRSECSELLSFSRTFKLSVENNPRMYWFCLNLLYDWSKKLRYSLTGNQMHNLHLSRLGHPRFPALLAGCLLLLWVSLALQGVFISSDWLFLLLSCFWFYDTQSKSALLRVSISRSFFRDVAFFSDLIKLKVAVP